MSHLPPHGPPPPYGYNPPPPNNGVAYVTAPVIMPVYPPGPPPPEVMPTQPTFVTNHYYPHHPMPGQMPMPQPMPQPPMPQPMPPQPVELPPDYHWVSATTATASTFSSRAFIAGKEGWDSSPLWVIRAHHSGEFIPGKLAIKHRAAYVPYNGKEVPVHNFEILLATPHAVRWLPSNNGQIPPGAISAGNTHTGEPLYIARVSHMNSLTPGKVHPSHQCAYISFGGQEISFKRYDVLCRTVA